MIPVKIILSILLFITVYTTPNYCIAVNVTAIFTKFKMMPWTKQPQTACDTNHSSYKKLSIIV